MKAKELIEILQTVSEDTEVFVGAWSPQEDYDHTDEIKVCKLNKGIVVCDSNTEYWNIPLTKQTKTKV